MTASVEELGDRVDAQTFHTICMFLNDEAGLLDEQRYEEWLALLTDDVVYQMPVRYTALDDAASEGRLGSMDHFDEDHYSLRKRVERLAGRHAWTENPPSRTRRFVSNVRGYRQESTGELRAVSYLLLFRSRLDGRPPEWVSAGRTDLLRSTAAGLRLARRHIVVDEVVLRTQNLAVFL